MSWIAAVRVALLVGVSSALGCHGASVDPEPRIPAGTENAEDPELKMTMRLLLDQSQQMGALLFTRKPLGPADRIQLARLLADMSRTSQTLQRSGGSKKHPLLTSHLGEYIREIEFARSAIEQDPPVYLPTAIVHGACVLCHQSSPRARRPAAAP